MCVCVRLLAGSLISCSLRVCCSLARRDSLPHPRVPSQVISSPAILSLQCGYINTRYYGNDSSQRVAGIISYIPLMNDNAPSPPLYSIECVCLFVVCLYIYVDKRTQYQDARYASAREEMRIKRAKMSTIYGCNGINVDGSLKLNCFSEIFVNHLINKSMTFKNII